MAAGKGKTLAAQFHGVAIEEHSRVGGLDQERCYPGPSGRRDHSAVAPVFGKQVGLRLHFRREHEGDGAARFVTQPGKRFLAPVARIHKGSFQSVPARSGRGKGIGCDTDGELRRSQALGTISTSLPRRGDRVGFCPGVLHARGAEAGDRPIHRAIAGLRTCRPAADAIAKFA